VPLFYDRDESGLPQGWVDRMRASLRSIGPAFSAQRMLRDYGERIYRD
jgi:starch phosphorylase